MSALTRTEHPHVRRDPLGRPVVGSARLEVHVLARLMQVGMPVDEMLEGYPFLTKAQILDALSFYCDHESEIEGLIRAQLAHEPV